MSSRERGKGDFGELKLKSFLELTSPLLQSFSSHFFQSSASYPPQNPTRRSLSIHQLQISTFRELNSSSSTSRRRRRRVFAQPPRPLFISNPRDTPFSDDQLTLLRSQIQASSVDANWVVAQSLLRHDVSARVVSLSLALSLFCSRSFPPTFMPLHETDTPPSPYSSSFSYQPPGSSLPSSPPLHPLLYPSFLLLNPPNLPRHLSPPPSKHQPLL